MNANTIVMRGKIQNHSRWNMSVLCRFGRIAAGYITSTNGPRGRCEEHFINGSYLHFKNGARKWMLHFSLQTDSLIERTLSHFGEKKTKKKKHYKLSCASFFLLFLEHLGSACPVGEEERKFLFFNIPLKHCLLFLKDKKSLCMTSTSSYIDFVGQNML